MIFFYKKAVKLSPKVRHCRRCGVELESGVNTYPHFLNPRNHNYICKPCFRIKCSIRYHKVGKSKWDKTRLRLFEILGTKKCVKCGFSDIRALQFDHMNGDGYRDRKRRGGEGFFLYYIKHPEKAREKLQVLCANCNYIKKYEDKESGNCHYMKLDSYCMKQD